MPTQPTILVVDDDEAHRNMLRMMLRSWGYAVCEADAGDSAIDAVHNQPFDAVLTDVLMARVDGISALPGSVDDNPALPVLLLSP